MKDTQPLTSHAEFLGVGFNLLNEDEAVDAVFRLADQAKFAAVVTPNVDHIVSLASADDPQVREAYNSAALCLCDSRILALLARWSGLHLPVVPGSDLTAYIINDVRLAGRRVAIVGGPSAALMWLQHRRPDVSFVQFNPPMGVRGNPRSQLQIIDFVESSASSVVLFAIGAPQSELLAQELSRRNRAAGVGLCIGASIEFLTGAKRRAPRVLQAARLEWAHRLWSEPSRLWRRYLLRGPKILAIWWQWRRDHMV